MSRPRGPFGPADRGVRRRTLNLGTLLFRFRKGVRQDDRGHRAGAGRSPVPARHAARPAGRARRGGVGRDVPRRAPDLRRGRVRRQVLADPVRSCRSGRAGAGERPRSSSTASASGTCLAGPGCSRRTGGRSARSASPRCGRSNSTRPPSASGARPTRQFGAELRERLLRVVAGAPAGHQGHGSSPGPRTRPVDGILREPRRDRRPLGRLRLLLRPDAAAADVRGHDLDEQVVLSGGPGPQVAGFP